jgi:hypothetical protein
MCFKMNIINVIFNIISVVFIEGVIERDNEPELKDVGYIFVAGDGYYNENDYDNYYCTNDEEYEPLLREVGYTFIPGDDSSED